MDSAAPAGRLSNFRRLVLGCIDSYDSEQRRIFLHFSRSTRFAFFCTAPISNFADFSQIFLRKFPDFLGFLQNFAEILRNFSKNQQNLTQICKISEIRAVQKACMVRIEVTTLVLVGLVVALRLCSRDPPSRKLCGPGAVAIRLPGLSPTVRERSFCYYSDVVI